MFQKHFVGGVFSAQSRPVIFVLKSESRGEERVLYDERIVCYHFGRVPGGGKVKVSNWLRSSPQAFSSPPGRTPHGPHRRKEI